MEQTKSTSGKILLKPKHYIKVIVAFLISLVVVNFTMIIKFKYVVKVWDRDPTMFFVVVSVVLFLIYGCMLLYILFSRSKLLLETKVIYAIFTAMTMSYILGIFLSIISIYAIPATFAAYVIAPLAKRRDSFIANIFSNLLVVTTLLIEAVFGKNLNVERLLTMFIMGVIAGSVIAYLIPSESKRFKYLFKGFVTSVVLYSSLVFFVFLNSESTSEFHSGIIFANMSVFIPPIAGLILQPIFEQIFNLVTNSRLVELMDHNSPLIKRLREEASGTFNHSLAVANFAEMCAIAIGENPYLARASAYYHDVGKIKNPMYYKENQGGDANPHDALLPEVSADIIRAHTVQGYELCKEYRIPEEISHVTIQHHGTMVIPVFYNKAKQLTDGEVDAKYYSYKGVSPITKIAAIIMIADTSEAAIRSMKEPSPEKVEKFLTTLINDRVISGQFDNCDISLRDLDTIKRTIINAYGGQFHERIAYPDGSKVTRNDKN